MKQRSQVPAKTEPRAEARAEAKAHSAAAPRPELVKPERYPDARLAFRCDITAWVIMGVALVAILWLHLIAGLLAGLLVFELVQVIAGRHHLIGVSHRTGRIIAVCFVGVVTVALLGLGTFGLAT